MITTLLALALLQDGLPTEKDADAAVKKLKETVADAGDDAKIAAIQEALAVRHETVIRAVAGLIASETERVTIGGVLALGDADHPVAAELLAKMVASRVKQAPVLAALCSALGKLGWQNGVGPLVEVVKKVGDADVRPVVPEALNALGQIGSTAGVDAAIDLLRKLDGRGRDPWKNEGELRQAANGALRAMIGGDGANRSLEWDNWWRDNKQKLAAAGKTTWWVKSTMQRSITGPGEKAPADALAVVTRVVDPQPEPTKGKRKKP
jgi:HEAT repeat protein